jgi:hypothetical protein
VNFSGGEEGDLEATHMRLFVRKFATCKDMIIDTYVPVKLNFCDENSYMKTFGSEFKLCYVCSILLSKLFPL